MSEEKPTFKVTDRRLFNADGTPRDIVREEEPTPAAEQPAAAQPDAAATAPTGAGTPPEAATPTGGATVSSAG